MKTYRLIGASVALLFGLILVPARAENSSNSSATSGATTEATSPTKPASPMEAPQPAKKKEPKKHQSRLDVLTEKLSLTEEQKEKISLILKDQRAAEKQLKKDISLPDDLRRTRRREIADSHEDQIREVLTQPQRAAFDQLTMKEHARNRM